MHTRTEDSQDGVFFKAIQEKDSSTNSFFWSLEWPEPPPLVLRSGNARKKFNSISFSGAEKNSDRKLNSPFTRELQIVWRGASESGKNYIHWSALKPIFLGAPGLYYEYFLSP